MAEEDYQHNIFMYDQDLEQEVDTDTLNFLLEADLEMEMADIQENAGNVRTQHTRMYTHTLRIIIKRVASQKKIANGFYYDSSGGSSLSCSPPVKKKNKVRLLRKDERTALVQDIDKAMIIVNVMKSVPTSLVSSLFPERIILWNSISNTEELNNFIEHMIEEYIRLYEKYSKGREKYISFLARCHSELHL